MKIIEVETLEDIICPNYYGCGAYEWCAENNEFHIGAKSGERFYINFSKETRLSGKRKAKSFMKILKGENSKWSKDMLLFDTIDKCLEYKRGNGVRADIRKLRLIREL